MRSSLLLRVSTQENILEKEINGKLVSTEVFPRRVSFYCGQMPMKGDPSMLIPYHLRRMGLNGPGVITADRASIHGCMYAMCGCPTALITEEGAGENIVSNPLVDRRGVKAVHAYMQCLYHDGEVTAVLFSTYDINENAGKLGGDLLRRTWSPSLAK